MQENGLGPAQVTQVRGFADQNLRKPKEPEDPSNRRISVIVEYIKKEPVPAGAPVPTPPVSPPSPHPPDAQAQPHK
jgi:chemotaxis protein MotB